MTDRERLDWLEKEDFVALLSDRHGGELRWAICGDSVNFTGNEGEMNFETYHAKWRPSIREAIDAAMEGRE